MKPRLLFVSFVCFVVSLQAGCMAIITKGQLERKIPRIDAKRVEIEASTIYGVSGTLTEENVKWDGDRKKVGKSVYRITTPGGSYKETIEGAAISDSK